MNNKHKQTHDEKNLVSNFLSAHRAKEAALKTPKTPEQKTIAKLKGCIEELSVKVQTLRKQSRGLAGNEAGLDSDPLAMRQLIFDMIHSRLAKEFDKDEMLWIISNYQTSMCMESIGFPEYA